MTKKIIDWDLVEADWRAGVKTKQQMSVEHNVSRAAMDKRFAKLAIGRDLQGKIRAKADALVTQSVVTRGVTSNPATERQIVEANAELQKNIILSHRTDIQKGRRIAIALLDELDAQTGDVGALVGLGELMLKPDKNGMDKLNDQYHKIISMPGRVDSMKKLSDTLKNLIALERQAFNLGDINEGDENPLKSFLTMIQSRNSRLPIKDQE